MPRKSMTCSRNAALDTMIADMEAHALTWGGYIIRPDDRKLTNTSEAPDASGVYAWYTKDCELVYVGRSTSIRNRLIQHERRTMFTCTPTYYSYREVPHQWVAGVENSHIRKLGPYENRYLDSFAVPFRDELEAAIEGAWREVLPGQKERLEAKYMKLAEDVAKRI